MKHYQSAESFSLATLKGEYSNDSVVFTAGAERAVVRLRDGRISSVEHTFDGVTKEIHEPLKRLEIGERNFQRKVDHYVIKNTNGEALMRLGQTFHVGDGGTWSSLPHDFENFPEPGFEELFFYILRGGSQRAIQVGKGLFHDGAAVDDAWLVSDREFSQIPMGYHPVGGEPDVVVSYVWCYLCVKPEWEKV